MRILLGCLMCLVLPFSEAFAISGGPFGGNGQLDVTGIYAGVLVPRLDPTVGLKDNSLALFTMTIPRSGLGTGTAVVFRNGIFYTGTVTASADAQTAKLSGVVNAVFQEVTSSSSSSTGSSQSIAAEYDANGRFAGARISANGDTSTFGSTRIHGSAALTYKSFRNGLPNTDPNGDSGGAISYKVVGFKQSPLTSNSQG